MLVSKRVAANVYNSYIFLERKEPYSKLCGNAEYFTSDPGADSKINPSSVDYVIMIIRILRVYITILQQIQAFHKY